jgi:hypothetical protein
LVFWWLAASFKVETISLYIGTDPQGRTLLYSFARRAIIAVARCNDDREVNRRKNRHLRPERVSQDRIQLGGTGAVFLAQGHNTSVVSHASCTGMIEVHEA